MAGYALRSPAAPLGRHSRRWGEVLLDYLQKVVLDHLGRESCDDA